MHVHSSWHSLQALRFALNAKCSTGVISFLVHMQDLTLVDKETECNILHDTAKSNCSEAAFKVIHKSIPASFISKFLESKDKRQLYPLDYAMEHYDGTIFPDLIASRAYMCSDIIAIKYYQKCAAKKGSPTAIQQAFRVLMLKNRAVEWRVALEELLPPTGIFFILRTITSEAPANSTSFFFQDNRLALCLVQQYTICA